MANKKSFNFRTPSSTNIDSAEVADALLKIIGVGVAGGILLVKGAQKVGEKLETVLTVAQDKLDERRAADRAKVRNIVESKEEGLDD